MQINEQNDSQNQQSNQQVDISSYPLPIRIKHPSWAARKGTYQQILYYLKTISSPTQQILISGASYTVQTLLPYFQNLIQQKHAVVLLKGLQCVQKILLLDKKAYSKHCIRSLVDKGIQYFPLLSQQRKAILQKFLDVLQLSKIQSAFLKNKLNLPHQKSVMYVIQVIGVLNMTSLKGVLLNLSKKHQKKCVRELALQIAEQMHQNFNQTTNQNSGLEDNKSKSVKPSGQQSSQKTAKSPSNNCKYTIQKLPHYQQLISKKQQQYSAELAQKIQFIIEEYTLAHLPNFSHILRLMIDDNNHIINMNGIKCLIAIFLKQKDDGMIKNSLIPVSFPLLFIFNKFKSHKTHPINSLLLTLIEAILQSTSNRVNDLFLAINEGLNSIGSKANVKFGCALSFFRIISLLYQNEDLHACTTNENIQNQNEDIHDKFNAFKDIKIGKNLHKTVQKIMNSLDKQKKYETELYLIKYGIGLDVNNLINTGSSKDLMINNKGAIPRYSSQAINKAKSQQNHKQQQVKYNTNKNTKITNNSIKQKQKQQHKTISSSKSLSLSKTLKQTKSCVKFAQINIQLTLNNIIKQLNQHNQYQQKKANFTIINNLLQKSSQQFYQCVKQKRYQMFYLCQLLQHFITNYQPNDLTIQHVSQYLISLLKIISLLKPMTIISEYNKDISLHNTSQLLLVALCKLVISQEIQQILENINQNYGFQIIFQSLKQLFVYKKDNKIKKKNKKFLLDWLESNTPAMYLNQNYYQLINVISQKQSKKPKSIPIDNQIISENQPKLNQKIGVKQIIQSPKKKFQQQINQPSSSNKKQTFQAYELQNINLSKIQKNTTQLNDYDEDMQKSSFHQNIEEHLRQIRTHRSYQDQNCNLQKNNEQDMSRQYLKHLKNEQFKKKNDKTQQNEDKILESSPFKSQINEKQDLKQQDQYEQKLNEVQKRRIERQRERRQFMNRMKYQFKPMINKNNDDQDQQPDVGSQQEEQYLSKKQKITGQQKIINDRFENQQDNYDEMNDKDNYSKYQSLQMNLQKTHNMSGLKQSNQYHKHQQQNSPLKNNYIQQHNHQSLQNNSINKQDPSKIQQVPDCSFVSSTSSGQFKYRQLNQQKLSYMLKTTSNPYHHLRNLILIPFKGSTKKHQFLKQLLHFCSNHVEFKIPQPYTSLILLTILMFSQIKQDKTLIQPLQSLYELLAKQSTTNDFIKTIINLFHTVIQQTLPQNRKFLITILLKSMIRMLPFIQDGLSLLRDIQQFYQIGQMVYFQMFEEQYTQIKSYMEEEAIHIVVQKAFQQQEQNLISIVHGWLNTQWKTVVLQVIQEFKNQNSQIHQQDQHQQHQNYQSYI